MSEELENVNENFYMRLRELEKEVAQLTIIMQQNSKILDDIREHVNRPVNWQGWIGTAVGVMTVFGALLYSAYIAPLEDRVVRLEAITAARTEAVDDYYRRYAPGIEETP